MLDPSFRAALDKNQKWQWHRRIVRRLEDRVDVLGADEAVALLRRVEELVAKAGK